MDYKIEAIDVLLCEDCILPRYVPLIPYKKTLLDNLIRNHRLSKSECMTLSDDDLIEMGLPDEELAKLFRSFLVMYDVKPGKFKEIAAVAANEDEKKSIYIFAALHLLRVLSYHAKCREGNQGAVYFMTDYHLNIFFGAYKRLTNLAIEKSELRIL